MAVMEKQQFQALCRRIGQGDNAAFTKLYVGFANRLVYWLIYHPRGGMPKEDAENIVQDTFEDILNQLRQYWREGRTDFFNDLGCSYLWKIAVNKRKDYFTRKHKHPWEINPIPIDQEAEMNDEDKKKLATEDSISLDQLIKLLDRLPETQQRVLYLEHIDGCSPKQIQDHFGWNAQATVNYHRDRGLKNLSDMLSPMAENAIPAPLDA